MSRKKEILERLTGKKIIIHSVHQTNIEEYNEIKKAIKLGKKFVPIMMDITYMEHLEKPFYISLKLELEND